jgi:hypothetical protein
MSQWLVPCRRCGLLIAWETNANGKRVPLDPDGRLHFVKCKPTKLEGVK